MAGTVPVVSAHFRSLEREPRWRDIVTGCGVDRRRLLFTSAGPSHDDTLGPGGRSLNRAGLHLGTVVKLLLLLLLVV